MKTLDTLFHRPSPAGGFASVVLLALFLTACGGGGAGLTLPQPVMSRPAPQPAAALEARPAATPEPQPAATPEAQPAATPQPQLAPAPPPVSAPALPPGFPRVSQLQVSQLQVAPRTPPVTAKSILVNTGNPADFPDDATPKTKNLNSFAPPTNLRPDIQVQQRTQAAGDVGGDGVRYWQLKYTHANYGDTEFPLRSLQVNNLWLTYPHNAGANDMKVHIRTRVPLTSRGFTVKIKEAVDESDHELVNDFFLVEAHLQAPGTGVQPTGTGNATWTGKVIAFENTPDQWLTRGFEIGGDASITVNLPTRSAGVSLTNLKSSRAVKIDSGAAVPSTYPDQTWSGLSIDSSGAFSSTAGGRKINGAFRHQGATGTSPNTVGGVFEAPRIKGGFVATRQ